MCFLIWKHAIHKNLELVLKNDVIKKWRKM